MRKKFDIIPVEDFFVVLSNEEEVVEGFCLFNYPARKTLAATNQKNFENVKFINSENKIHKTGHRNVLATYGKRIEGLPLIEISKNCVVVAAKVKEATGWIYRGYTLKVLKVRKTKGQLDEKYGDSYDLCLKGTNFEERHKSCPYTVIYEKDLELIYGEEIIEEESKGCYTEEQMREAMYFAANNMLKTEADVSHYIAQLNAPKVPVPVSVELDIHFVEATGLFHDSVLKITDPNSNIITITKEQIFYDS